MAYQEKGGQPGLVYPHVLKCFDEVDDDGEPIEGGYLASADATPATVGLRCPTEARKRELIDFGVHNGKRTYTATAELIAQDIAWVKNYKGQNGKPIKNARDFQMHARASAVLEVFDVLINHAEAFSGEASEEKKGSSD